MSLPYPGLDAVPFTPITAEFNDKIIANIEAVADGTGLDSTVITGEKLATTNVIFATFTPAGASNVTSGTFVDLSGSVSIAVPSWATSALAQVNTSGLFNVTGDSIMSFRAVIGTDNGTEVTTQFDTIADAHNDQFSWASLHTITATGTKTLKLQAKRASGSGELRTATNAPLTFIIMFK